MQSFDEEMISVESGSRTLKDAMNEALRDWVTNVHNTFYCIGTVAGPHPYPMMVRDFQSVIGREARAQMLAQAGRLPDAVVACVGGGSNAIGIFDAFVAPYDAPLIAVAALQGKRGAVRVGVGDENYLGGGQEPNTLVISECYRGVVVD